MKMSLWISPIFALFLLFSVTSVCAESNALNNVVNAVNSDTAKTSAQSAPSAEQMYRRRSLYTGIIKASEPYMVGVGECVQVLHRLNGCNAGSNHVPSAYTTKGSGIVASITVVNGVITITPVAKDGIVPEDTYIATPTIDSKSGIVSWMISGGGIRKGYAYE